MKIYYDDMVKGIPFFMDKYALSLPGTSEDGGAVDFRDPAYSPYFAPNNTSAISYPTTPVEAAWKSAHRPKQIVLTLKVSKLYKMLPTGRMQNLGEGQVAPLKGSYETGKDIYTGVANKAPGTAKDLKGTIKSHMEKTGERIADGWFNCYFLPFFQGRICQMQLGQGADYFFTAAMNGCSFLVTGNVQNPTVKHLNDYKFGDEVDPSVTKATHKQRYANMIGAGNAGDALLSKYKPTGFTGHSERYKVSDDDRNAHPNLTIEDINTFVVGVRATNGDWSFYYQRSAVVKSTMKIKKVDVTKDIKFVPTTLWQKIRRRQGKEYEGKFVVPMKSEKGTVSTLHPMTKCARLPFP